MGLETTTIKHILLLLNFIFSVLAIVLIGFGIYIVASPSNNQVDHGEKVAGGLIIALGVVIIIVAIFGCLAAIHEARIRIMIYVISLVVLLLVQLSMVGMASQGTKDGLAGSVHDGFEELWKYELETPGALAYYENWLHCCGVNNTGDYKLINHPIPHTCCKDFNCRIPENVYTIGCQEKFEEYLAGKLLVFSIVCWILIIAEAVAAVFGWMMFSSLKNRSRRENLRWM